MIQIHQPDSNSLRAWLIDNAALLIIAASILIARFV
jgi:hypothetical protein